MFSLKAVLLLAACASAPAMAQSQKPATPATIGPDIIVTGTSLKDAKAALAACIAQHCPPDKDIDATLAVAETQFVAGDYKDARGTMLQSISRNRRFAKEYPVPVSDLFRANSRVAAHLGEEGSYVSSALDVLTTLKGSLPENDYRVFGAQLELADSFVKTGRADSGFALYRRVARQARAAAVPGPEGYARLRIAMVFAAMSQVRDDENYSAALSAANDLIAERNPALAGYVQAAKLLRANMAVKNGDPGAIDRLIAEYRSAGAKSKAPVLLYAPAIKQRPLSGREGRSGETLTQAPMDSFDDQWVDVSFLVAADGKVADVDVLRKSGKLNGDWVKPILTAVAGRRYAPLGADSAGAFRVERYSFTSEWTTITGTRVRVRSPVPRIELVDLSRDAVAAPGS